MDMTFLKGFMNAGTTGRVMVNRGGVGGIGGMTVAMTVGTMGVVDDPFPAALRIKVFSAFGE